MQKQTGSGERRAAQPRNWTEAMNCLALWVIPRRDAEEFLREAVLAAFATGSLHDLTPAMRALAFQHTRITIDLLERDGCPLDMVGPDGNRDFLLWPTGSITDPEGPTYRERICAAFTRGFGVEVLGPPWQIGTADDRPPYDEWAALCEE